MPSEVVGFPFRVVPFSLCPLFLFVPSSSSARLTVVPSRPQTQPDGGAGVPRAAPAGHHDDRPGRVLPDAAAAVLLPALQVPHRRRHLQQPRPAAVGRRQHALPQAAPGLVRRW